MLKLNKEKSETMLQWKVAQIESKIEFREKRINEAGYQLSDPNPEEIEPIESVIKLL